jgi:hypothetical protein
MSMAGVDGPRAADFIVRARHRDCHPSSLLVPGTGNIANVSCSDRYNARNGLLGVTVCTPVGRTRPVGLIAAEAHDIHRSRI